MTANSHFIFSKIRFYWRLSLKCSTNSSLKHLQMSAAVFTKQLRLVMISHVLKLCCYNFYVHFSYYYYLRRCIVTLCVTLTLYVCVCVCPPSSLYHVSTARRISLGGEGNVLCSLVFLLFIYTLCSIYISSK